MIYPVVLCGGYGTRLWPLSRTNLPKQFIKAFAGKSLFQNTIARISNKKLFKSPYIVTNIDQRYLVKEQLKEEGIDSSRIYLEPEPHSTAPAVAIAALDIVKQDPNAVILALSSDNEIKKPKTFVRTLSRAADVAIKNKKFLLFSSKPTYAETGYGYIKNGKILNSMKDEVHVHEIFHFVEKPSFSETAACIKAGYHWNCGIFLLPAKQFLQELGEFSPNILEHCKNTLKKSQTNDEDGHSWTTLDKKSFGKCPVDSIDYAVMEKTKNSAVVRTNIGWYDVGTWQTLYELLPKDFDGNIISGEVISINNKNSHIYSTDKTRVLAAIDVNDLTIVQTSDATLIIPRERSQDVRKIISILKERKSINFLQDTKTYYNWGSVEIFREGQFFKIKKLLVKQTHTMKAKGNPRTKHLIITQGSGVCEYGEKKVKFKTNDSLMIEKNIPYRIKNTSKTELEIIKIENKKSSSLKNLDDLVAI